MIARSREAVSHVLAEQLAPVLHLHAELARGLSVPIDVPHAVDRLRLGQPAFDPTAVLRAAGDLSWPFQRAVAAFDMAGMTSTAAVVELRRQRISPQADLAAWLANEPLPGDAARRLARRAAALVGSAVLGRAAATVLAETIVGSWRAPVCPACGGAPDLAIAHGDGRTLVCAHCDTRWERGDQGCLGCGAATEPTIARVRAAYLGYTLVICNSCCRYLKERGTATSFEPLVDRALTAELDVAAERRGLRV